MLFFILDIFHPLDSFQICVIMHSIHIVTNNIHHDNIASSLDKQTPSLFLKRMRTRQLITLGIRPQKLPIILRIPCHQSIRPSTLLPIIIRSYPQILNLSPSKLHTQQKETNLSQYRFHPSPTGRTYLEPCLEVFGWG